MLAKRVLDRRATRLANVQVVKVLLFASVVRICDDGFFSFDVERFQLLVSESRKHHAATEFDSTSLGEGKSSNE